ncbi:MAG: hypothetical protein AAF738_11760, partial [Bacteroidota bacterium]
KFTHQCLIASAAMMILCTSALRGSSFSTTTTIDSISIYIFLHESCKISQYYTLPLNELYQEYASEQVQFVGLFPNFNSKPDKIAAFKQQYDILFELKTDYYHIKKERFGATVTPEVVVYHEGKQQILYQGRIDDTYFRVGKKRQVTSTAELADVLKSITNEQPIKVASTTPIGCFIGKSSLK